MLAIVAEFCLYGAGDRQRSRLTDQRIRLPYHHTEAQSLFGMEEDASTVWNSLVC